MTRILIGNVIFTAPIGEPLTVNAPYRFWSVSGPAPHPGHGKMTPLVSGGSTTG
jgi:hypothetical protein